MQINTFGWLGLPEGFTERTREIKSQAEYEKYNIEDIFIRKL